MSAISPGSPAPAPAPASAPASDRKEVRLLVDVSFLSSSQSSSQSSCRLLSAQGLDVDDDYLSVETVKGKPGLKKLIIETKEAKIALQNHIVETCFNEEKTTLLARIMLQEQILREMYRSKDVTLVKAGFQTFSNLGELKNKDEDLGRISESVKRVLKDVKFQISCLISNEISKRSLIDSKVRMSVGGSPPQTSVGKMLFFYKFTTKDGEKKVNRNFNNQNVLVFLEEKGDSRHDADPMKPSVLKTGFKYSKRFFQALLLPVKAPYNKYCSKDKTWLGILDKDRRRFPTNETKIGDLKKMFSEF